MNLHSSSCTTFVLVVPWNRVFRKIGGKSGVVDHLEKAGQKSSFHMVGLWYRNKYPIPPHKAAILAAAVGEDFGSWWEKSNIK